MNLLIEISLRATLVLTLAFALTRRLGGQPAALRHMLWICAFSIAGATPALLRFGPRIQIERPAPPPSFESAIISRSIDKIDPEPPPASRFRPRLRFKEIPFLEIIWIAGILPFVIRAWSAARKARALLRSATFLEDLPALGLPEAGARS